MIKDFADKRTAAMFHGVVVKTLDSSLQEAARIKLFILNNAVQVDDLRLSPSNRLEKLSGDHQGCEVSGLTVSGAFVSAGLTVTHSMLNRSIAIEVSS